MPIFPVIEEALLAKNRYREHPKHPIYNIIINHISFMVLSKCPLKLVELCRIAFCTEVLCFLAQTLSLFFPLFSLALYSLSLGSILPHVWVL